MERNRTFSDVFLESQVEWFFNEDLVPGIIEVLNKFDPVDIEEIATRSACMDEGDLFSVIRILFENVLYDEYDLTLDDGVGVCEDEELCISCDTESKRGALRKIQKFNSKYHPFHIDTSEYK